MDNFAMDESIKSAMRRAVEKWVAEDEIKIRELGLNLPFKGLQTLIEKPDGFEIELSKRSVVMPGLETYSLKIRKDNIGCRVVSEVEGQQRNSWDCREFKKIMV